MKKQYVAEKVEGGWSVVRVDPGLPVPRMQVATFWVADSAEDEARRYAERLNAVAPAR